MRTATLGWQYRHDRFTVMQVAATGRAGNGNAGSGPGGAGNGFTGSSAGVVGNGYAGSRPGGTPHSGVRPTPGRCAASAEALGCMIGHSCYYFLYKAHALRPDSHRRKLTPVMCLA